MRNRRMKRRLAFLLILFLLVTVGGFNTFRDGGQSMVSHAAGLEQMAGSSAGPATVVPAENANGDSSDAAKEGTVDGAGTTDAKAASGEWTGTGEDGTNPTADGDVAAEEPVDGENPDAIYVCGKANVLAVDASRKVLRRANVRALAADPKGVTDVPEHHKTITKKGEDLYTVTLDIQGKRQVIEGEKPKIDVLLIVDRSGSMDFSMGNHSTQTRLQALKSVITDRDGLSEALLGTEAQQNMDARVAVVAYSGSKGDNDAAYNDAETVVEWTNRKSAVDSAVNRLEANGGTNCEAGLREGASVLGDARPDAQKFVVFLTDGQPTLFYANGKDYYTYWWFGTKKSYYTAGKTLGSGSEDSPGSGTPIYNDGSTTPLGNGICSSRAYDQMEAITGLSGFYSIACSPDASTTFTTNMLQHTDAAVKKQYSAKDPDGMIEAFKEIKQSITTLAMQNVTIHDEMSNYADVVINGSTFGTSDYTLHVKDASGKEVAGEAAKAFEAPTLEGADGKELRLKFKAGYELNPDYTYSVSFDIKPTYEAYKALMEGGTDAYAAPNGDGTGFFSNGDAWLTYDYGGETNLRVEYTEHPTFALESKTMTIEKQWRNRNGTPCTYDHPDFVHIKLTATSPEADKAPVVQEFDVQLTEDWKFTMTVPKNYFSYEVEETPVDGYTPSYEETDDGFLVTNTSKIVETGVWMDQTPAFVVLLAGLILSGVVVSAWTFARRRK